MGGVSLVRLPDTPASRAGAMAARDGLRIPALIPEYGCLGAPQDIRVDIAQLTKLNPALAGLTDEGLVAAVITDLIKSGAKIDANLDLSPKAEIVTNPTSGKREMVITLTQPLGTGVICAVPPNSE